MFSKPEIKNKLEKILLQKTELISDIIFDLSKIENIQAISLGGSYATGKNHKNSDIDLGLYYLENKKFDIEKIKNIADKFDINNKPVVTDFYEWGPWVNGGAWINTKIVKVDFLYRNINQIQEVINNSKVGKWQWDYAQQPPNGFYSVIYLAETNSNIILFDPNKYLEKLKTEVIVYPDALQKSLVQDNLWGSVFTISQAKKFVSKVDLYNFSACITRIFGYLTQVLYALNKAYFLTDKDVLNNIENFEIKPKNYKNRVISVLNCIGSNEIELKRNIDIIDNLITEIKKMAIEKKLYIDKFKL